MAITRNQKAEILDGYRELVKKSPALVFTNYRGTSVKQINALRTAMKESGADYVVVKNTLLRVALEEQNRVHPESLLSGPNGVFFINVVVDKTV